MTIKYKLVPLDPTDEMIEKLMCEWDAVGATSMYDNYTEMLEAAPQVESEPVAWRYQYIEYGKWQYSNTMADNEIIEYVKEQHPQFKAEALFTHPPADKADAERIAELESQNKELVEALQAMVGSCSKHNCGLKIADDVLAKVKGEL